MNKEELSPYYKEVENGYRQLSYEEVVEDLQKEIERLNNDIKILLQENGNKEKVIKAQDNIIKEVREYAQDLRLYDNESLEFKMSSELLEILDKEVN